MVETDRFASYLSHTFAHIDKNRSKMHAEEFPSKQHDCYVHNQQQSENKHRDTQSSLPLEDHDERIVARVVRAVTT